MSMMTMKTDRHDPCCCPVCRGLEVAERPLFGTGQTLTAADLTALQDYVQNKNRLHNRFQHGWGVVCGLEVLCHDCEGSVTIRPGYAIDPCGNDIVVADAVRYDVIEAIRDCTRAKRRHGDECDPWVPPRDEGCDEALSHWCVAVRYREVETAVGQRLTTGGIACETVGKGISSDGCGCGGSCGCGGGGSCGCGGGGSCGCGSCETPKTRAIAEYKPTSLAASNACAPRRVRECFDVTLVPRDAPCAPRMYQRDPQNDTTARQPLGLIGWLIPEKSLLRNIIDCVVNDTRILSERLTPQDAEVLSRLGSSTAAELASSDLDLDDVHLAICHARAAVLDILQDDHGTTRCQLLRATAEVKLAPPARSDSSGAITENRADYIARAQDMANDLLAAWIQGILDCICRAFLPKCPEDPCDDRVELACISVKGGKILSICNHSCRKYAGSFPSMFYWMSLVPLIPLFARLLAMLCCQPDLLRRNSPLVNDLMPLLDRVDPTGRLRREVVKDDFALPRRYVAMAAKFADTPVIPTLSAQLERVAAAAIDPAYKPAGRDPGEADLRTEVETLKAQIAELQGQIAPKSSTSRTGSKAARSPSRSTKTTRSKKS